MSATPAELYAAHHAELLGRYEAAMAEQEVDGIVVFAGAPRYAFQDDRPYPFLISPWYRQWVPARDHAWSLIALHRTGAAPDLTVIARYDGVHLYLSVPREALGFVADTWRRALSV